MPAFLVATVTIKDEAKLGEYAARVGPTMAPFGGEAVLRGKAEKALAGGVGHDMAAVFRFPDLEAIERWYASADYQALIPLREAAAETGLVAYTAPD